MFYEKYFEEYYEYNYNETTMKLQKNNDSASNNDTDCNFGLEFLPTGSTVEIYCYKNGNGGSIEFNGTDISPPGYPDRVFWRTLTTNSSPNDTLTLKVNADWIAKVEDGRIGNVELKKIAQEAIPTSDNLTVEDQHIDVMLKPEGTELPDKPNLTVVQ